jgi:4-hydroxybenzoate polyprenyltransferase
MENGRPGDVQRRITFLSSVLGVMVGLGLVMIALYAYTRSPFVLIAVLPLVVSAIPVLRAIKQLRDRQRQPKSSKLSDRE